MECSYDPPVEFDHSYCHLWSTGVSLSMRHRAKLVSHKSNGLVSSENCMASKDSRCGKRIPHEDFLLCQDVSCKELLAQAAGWLVGLQKGS